MAVTLRSVRHWASAAAFHGQMLVHLAALEGKQESPAAKAALQQYREDLMQITPAYRSSQVYIFVLAIIYLFILATFFFLQILEL